VKDEAPEQVGIDRLLEVSWQRASSFRRARQLLWSTRSAITQSLDEHRGVAAEAIFPGLRLWPKRSILIRRNYR